MREDRLRGSPSASQRQQQMLGGDVLVLEVVGFFEGLVEQRCAVFGESRLCADAGNLRQALDLTVGLRQYCCGCAPTFSSTGTTMPSRSSSSAASKCTGSNSGLPFCEAISMARCIASCALTVSFIPTNCHIEFSASLQSSQQRD